MSASITWSGGGTAVIELIDDDRVELVSTRAFAPGSRPEGTVALAANCHPASRPEGTVALAAGCHPASRPEGTVAVPANSHAIWLKSHGSRRQPDGTFRVKGRLLNVRREVLDLLKEVVPGPNGGKSSTS